MRCLFSQLDGLDQPAQEQWDQRSLGNASGPPVYYEPTETIPFTGSYQTHMPMLYEGAGNPPEFNRHSYNDRGQFPDSYYQTLYDEYLAPRTLDGLAPSRPSRPSSTDSSLDEGLASGNEQQMGYGNSQVCIAAGHTRRLIFCSSLNLETGPKSCRARCIPPHLGHCLLQTIEDITMDLLEGLYRPFWISRSVP